ncbi:MAG: hypothetical protein PF961_23020 [Planctomycetota bacterium]|jgi:beta-mannosidase|nr:hypothetical protein [Planctomycetota bacterium]
MRTLSLNGTWTARHIGSSLSVPATVPGTIHQDLLAAGTIPDWNYRDQEKAQFWVGESDWRFDREFTVDAELLTEDEVELHCGGLDTLATIGINGTEVGRTDNQFRSWTFPIKSLLKRGRNRIRISFASALRYHQAREQAERPLRASGVSKGPGGNDREAGHRRCGGGYVRKQPCSFGWDWGVKTDTCGIWRSIELRGVSHARIDHVTLTQEHGTGLVTCGAAIHLDARPPKGSTLRTSIFYGTALIDHQQVRAVKSGQVALNVRKPKLWWPAGLGDQPLYTIMVELCNADGEPISRWQRRIGLRRLELDRHPDKWGETFQFACNGQPFFAKGANWIPDRVLTTTITEDMYRQRLTDTVAANMNMLRVWGGGIYEPDVFYELCDELGICVWQDFMFACAMYPTFDKAFLANVKAEATEQIRRLQHHSCIALWCGNNELEQMMVAPKWTDTHMSWREYEKLFDKLLGDVVAAEDPTCTYWPSSPHSPHGERANHRNATCGDAHLWDVWHGRKPFEWYRSCEHRFNSEFGFQSFPEPRTVATYTEPEDRNVTSYIMEYHQRSPIGNGAIMQYMTDWFQMPGGFNQTLWLSQILQGMAMKYACEHWRRSMPRGMGTLYWQLNDCWPVASWASIDSLGRWKALQYMARHFFAPVLISGVEDKVAGSVAVHLTNERKGGVTADCRWTITTANGKSLMTGSTLGKVGMMKSRTVTSIDCGRLIERHGERNLLIWLEAVVDGTVCSRNLVTFARPKHLELEEPDIGVSIKPAGAGFDVRLKAKRPALWAFLGCGVDATYSDNFVHLAPGKAQTIRVTPERSMSFARFRKALDVQHLLDTKR